MSLDQALLVAYADGELDATEARELERLLADDAAARQQVDIFRTTRALLRAACDDTVYANVPKRLRDMLQAR